MRLLRIRFYDHPFQKSIFDTNYSSAWRIRKVVSNAVYISMDGSICWNKFCMGRFYVKPLSPQTLSILIQYQKWNLQHEQEIILCQLTHTKKIIKKRQYIQWVHFTYLTSTISLGICILGYKSPRSASVMIKDDSGRLFFLHQRNWELNQSLILPVMVLGTRYTFKVTNFILNISSEVKYHWWKEHLRFTNFYW